MSEREQAVQWLREWSDEVTAKIAGTRSQAHRASMEGHAFILRHIAAQIEDGAHTRTRAENRERFAKKLGLPFTKPRVRSDV